MFASWSDDILDISLAFWQNMQASQFIGCMELLVDGNGGGVVSGAVVVPLAADSAASFFYAYMSRASEGRIARFVTNQWSRISTKRRRNSVNGRSVSNMFVLLSLSCRFLQC